MKNIIKYLASTVTLLSVVACMQTTVSSPTGKQEVKTMASSPQSLLAEYRILQLGDSKLSADEQQLSEFTIFEEDGHYFASAYVGCNRINMTLTFDQAAARVTVGDGIAMTRMMCYGKEAEHEENLVGVLQRMNHYHQDNVGHLLFSDEERPLLTLKKIAFKPTK